MNTSEKEALDPTERVASDLVHIMCAANGLNEFFENALPPIAETFGAKRSMLIDYHENTNHFDLLHFGGYQKQARFDLQRALVSMNLERALTERQAYFLGDDRNRLYLPLYFASTLEALIVLEADLAIELTPVRQQIARVVSKFIGLLMSSSLLGINHSALVDSNDLQRARQIQLTYLPPENLQTDRYEVYGYNRSSSMVGGDYFDYFRIREKSIQCVLADASGHGLAAALIMSTFRGLLHAGIAECRDCAALFTTLNLAVHSGSSVVQYLTGVFLDFDESCNRLTYTNAGHFDPAIIRGNGIVERLTGGGPPLGMFKNSRYPAGETQIRSGDLLVLFTDGLADLRDNNDHLFGEERILELARKHRESPLKEIASSVLNDGISFSAPAQPEDDLTLFIMRFR
jgi:sigma-B regulation protein RsbU (phosphoserine phosphatase)